MTAFDLLFLLLALTFALALGSDYLDRYRRLRQEINRLRKWKKHPP